MSHLASPRTESPPCRTRRVGAERGAAPVAFHCEARTRQRPRLVTRDRAVASVARGDASKRTLTTRTYALHWLRGLASLLDLVVNVLLVRAQPEMLRADARRIVAAVKDVPAQWNRPMRDFPGDAAGPHNSTTAYADLPVPLLVPCAGPEPAVAVGVDLLPETLRQWTPHCDVRARSRTVTPTPRANEMNERHEGDSAMGTNGRRSRVGHGTIQHRGVCTSQHSRAGCPGQRWTASGKLAQLAQNLELELFV